MYREPLISVIIPCYNCERYVKQAINSIIEQSYRNLEIIIIDDCSTDQTSKIIEDISRSDDRIIFYKHSTNMKLIDTLNEMIDIASGDYIVRMDSDDVSDKNRIKMQLNYMLEHEECSLCGTQAKLIDSKGIIIGEKKLPHNHFDIYKLLPYGNVIIHPSIMIKAPVLKNNKFSKEYIHAEDYELWCRLIYKENIITHNIDYFGLYYRISEGQVSNIHVHEQVESTGRALLDYGLIKKSEINLHANVFMNYGQTDVFDNVVVKKYCDRLYSSFRAMNKEYAIEPMKELLHFLRNKNKKLFYRLCFTKLGIRTILIEMRDK